MKKITKRHCGDIKIQCCCNCKHWNYALTDAEKMRYGGCAIEDIEKLFSQEYVCNDFEVFEEPWDVLSIVGHLHRLSEENGLDEVELCLEELKRMYRDGEAIEG